MREAESAVERGVGLVLPPNSCTVAANAGLSGFYQAGLREGMKGDSSGHCDVQGVDDRVHAVHGDPHAVAAGVESLGCQARPLRAEN